MTEYAGRAPEGQSPREQVRPAWNFPSVGRWGASVLPNGWFFLSGFGVRQVMHDQRQIAASIGLGEDMLKEEGGLGEYITAQARMIEGHLSGAKTAGPQPTAFESSDQALLFMVRHKPEDVPEMLHVQTYVRSGLWLGIITLTTVGSELRTVRADYEAFLKGLRILAPEETRQAV